MKFSEALKWGLKPSTFKFLYGPAMALIVLLVAAFVGLLLAIGLFLSGHPAFGLLLVMVSLGAVYLMVALGRYIIANRIGPTSWEHWSA